METAEHFTFRKPSNEFLASIVEQYFYVDVAVSELSDKAEFIIPFPRISFGYFFDHPFIARNHSLNKSELVNVVISRISTQKITVQPNTDRIRILGAHLKAYGLAYFTQKSIKSLPWLISTEELFGTVAAKFLRSIQACTSTDEMFEEVEHIFLETMLDRDLSLISKATELIEEKGGHLSLKELSRHLGLSERTLRNHFYEYIGCSPKEYSRIVKLKQIAYQLKHSENSLTNIAYENNYFDQAHFIREVKDITGQSPNKLRKEIPHFRFLQF